jgi:tRNA threonylcarbamoyladenosine biosynthesis protein TsaE
MLVTVTEPELNELASQFSQILQPGMAIFLEGPLGAGKTTFVRGILRGLGYTQVVRSPTFTLVESYDFALFKVHHFDFYRLAQSRDVEEIGIRDYFSSDAVNLVEWASKVLPGLPLADLNVYIDFKDSLRVIRFEVNTPVGESILQKIVSM